MTEAARYMFDRTFDVPVKGDAAASRQLQDEWERKMADACCTAYEEGRSEGEALALKGIEEATRIETGILLENVRQMLEDVERECGRIRGNAIELATMTATLLAGELIAREPLANLESLFSDALELMDDAPHMALTVNDALAEGVQKRVASIAGERGFTGKIVVLGDPETEQGNCALQWADGGITRDLEKTSNAVSQIVRRHIDRLSAQPAGRSNAVPHANPSRANGAAPATDLAIQSQSEIEIVSETVTGSGEKI